MLFRHQLTLTVLKIFQHRQYRYFDHFDNTGFRADLLEELSLQNFHPGYFEILKILDIHALIKKKHVRYISLRE